MYSDFIEDRLAENSEHIALLKKGIKNFTPTWLESNFRQEIKQEAFKPVDDFFDNIFQSYDDNEKLFIYKSTYSQAGFKESIKNLEKFVPGMKVEITQNPFYDIPYLKFTKISDTEYVSEKISGCPDDINPHILLTKDDTDYEFKMPFTQVRSKPVWVYNDQAVQSTNPAVQGYIIEFQQTDGNWTPYIQSLVLNGMTAKWGIIGENENAFEIPVPDESETRSEISIVPDLLFLVKDEAASGALGTPMWFLNYRGNSISGIENFFLYVYHSTTALSFQIIGVITNYKLKMTASSAEALSDCMFRLQNDYICSLNPRVKWRTNSDVIFPSEKSFSSPPKYNITVSTTGEVFKDYELFQARFGYLVKELLYYYGVPTVKYNITYEINAINKEQHIIHVTPRIFKFIPISRSGVN